MLPNARYILGVVAQAAAYLSPALFLFAALGVFGPVTIEGFAAMAALALFGGITPMLIHCERCRVSYFWDAAAARKHKGGMNLVAGYNLIKPVGRRCRNCGFDRV